MGRPRALKHVTVDGEKMTEARAEYFKHLQEEDGPRTPKEVGDALGKTNKAAWKQLKELWKNGLVAKTNDHTEADQTDDHGNVLYRYSKGQGKYYVPGSSSDPDWERMRRLRERMKAKK